MRKYDRQNKRNFIIVAIICLIIISLFALFIHKVIEVGKKEYVIGSNSVLYDHEGNLITLDDEGVIKVKWSGAYYLIQDKEETLLDKQVVVFNTATKDFNLYGTIYKINMDESVKQLKNETKVEDSVIPKFYKLADRKYLLIAPTITSDSKEFSADNYLIVELDKMGNATLYNNKVNVKTLKPTKLKTNTFTFDIANEELDYAGTIINLRKIIGSTNLYAGDEEDEDSASSTGKNQSGSNAGGNASDNGNASNNTSGNGTNGSGSNSSNRSNGSANGNGSNASSSSNSSSNKTNADVNVEVDNKTYQDKNFSVIRNKIGTTTLSVDYQVYDPKDEYKSVYMEVTDSTNNNMESYFLQKSATNILIRGLKPQTRYNIVYKYTYLENGSMKTNTFNTSYSITTLLPNINISVSRLTNSEVIYSIVSDETSMLGANVNLYIDDVYKNTYAFSTSNLTSSFTGSFRLSDYGNFNYLTLKIDSITFANGKTPVDIEVKEKN